MNPRPRSFSTKRRSPQASQSTPLNAKFSSPKPDVFRSRQSLSSPFFPHPMGDRCWYHRKKQDRNKTPISYVSWKITIGSLAKKKSQLIKSFDRLDLVPPCPLSHGGKRSFRSITIKFSAGSTRSSPYSVMLHQSTWSEKTHPACFENFHEGTIYCDKFICGF